VALHSLLWGKYIGTPCVMISSLFSLVYLTSCCCIVSLVLQQELVPTTATIIPVLGGVGTAGTIAPTTTISTASTADPDIEADAADQTTPPATTTTTAVVHRVVSWGGLCGEVAITTQEPYMYTVVARGEYFCF